jgi:hypothetical protein
MATVACVRRRRRSASWRRPAAQRVPSGAGGEINFPSPSASPLFVLLLVRDGAPIIRRKPSHMLAPRPPLTSTWFASSLVLSPV